MRARFRLPIHPSPGEGGRTVVIPQGRTSQTRPVLAARFLSQFQCIAGDCEDLCCRDWLIAYDRPSHDKLRDALETEDAPTSMDSRFFYGDGSQPGAAYAYIKPKSDGWCGFLADDGLCEIHAHHGESMLSDSCSIFPRASISVGRRLEVGASLSCPEVARKLLLTESGGDLVPASADLLPRRWVGKQIDTSGADVYASAFDLVRDAAVSLTSARAFPIPVRLAALAQVASRTGSYYRPGITALDEDRLQRDWEAASTQSALRRVSRELDTLHVPTDGGLPFITDMLRQRTRLAHSDRYAALLKKVFASMEGESTAIAAEYDRRRALVEARFGARSEMLFRNYMLQHWRRYPYTSSASVLEHVCRLALRMAAIRFLFVGHPEIERLLASGDGDSRQALDVVDRVAVEVVQVFVKTFEHAEAIMKTVEAPLFRANPLSRAVVLAKLY